MSITEPKWEHWQGVGFPRQTSGPRVYYTFGEVDVEDTSVQSSLARQIHKDGGAPTLLAALVLLEEAVVTHGQVIDLGGRLEPYYGPQGSNSSDPGVYEYTSEATWVEVASHEG